jgi:hypothetical protein
LTLPRGVLAATAAANALIFLDQTSVTVALPAIQSGFDASRCSSRPASPPRRPSSPVG